MKVTICIGSSCHLKGSRFVVDGIKKLVSENNLENKVSLAAAFCTDKCGDGVSVTVDGKFFSVTPDNVEEFFNKNIKEVIK